MTGPDLKIVIQAVVLPLLVSKRGKNLHLGRLVVQSGVACVAAIWFESSQDGNCFFSCHLLPRPFAFSLYSLTLMTMNPVLPH